MIVVRCKACGVSVGIPLEEDKRNEYSEILSDTPCDQCTNKPKTIEHKLLEAIFGETNDYPIVLSNEESLEYVRLRYNQQWESTEDIPYADSIYKMIDDVVEFQLDHITDMELEDFYRYHMNKHYEDKRNAIEFNDAWMNYRSITDNV